MASKVVTFKDWIFDVDKDLTEQTYMGVFDSGAEACGCNDCKNYVAYRDKVFPTEIIDLFNNLGIDYRKEVEIISYEILTNGLHHIGGWFHFKGQILKGKNCLTPLPSGGHSIDLTRIAGNFSIGFTEDNAMTFFDDKNSIGTDRI